jgi:hypothetical protein
MSLFKRGLLTGFLILTGITTYAQSPYAQSPGRDFPIKPDSQRTPGKLCDQPTSHRYPEGIAYCDRNVSTDVKVEVIRVYNQELGFNIQADTRADYKIDHYIPLCMGGANSPENLWPQNRWVFQQSDPLEPLLCQKMAEGRLKQKDAIDLIMKGKNDLSQVAAIIRYANSL